MTEGPGGGIRLESVTKTYPNRVRAVDAVDLEIAPGEFMVLVGPSGCGKSTLLRMIAGLEEIDGGRIEIAGEDVTNVSPQERDIAMVFQNYALYPHMTVARNLAFGLRMRSTPKAEIERRVADVAQVLGLTDLLGRRPGQLSGGQRQRVAMGRAMVREPAAYLMDEPLSNLDAKLRVSMRAELARLHDRLRVATVYVTHDQIEAMTLGERVAVLRDGRLQQCDRPKVLYDQPANLFVAAFIGSPAMNLAEAEIGDGCARFAGMAVPLPGVDAFEGRRVVFGVRPPDLALAERDDPRPTIVLVPEVVEELGSESLVVAPIEARPVAVEAVAAARDAHAGGDDRLLMDDARATWTMRIAGRASVRVGEPLRVALDPAHVHLFDPESGATLTLGA